MHISKGANVEININYNGWTPLHFASYNGESDNVIYFVCKGANKNGTTPYDLTNNQ